MTILKISDDCFLENDSWGGMKIASLNYTERAADHYHSDSETSITIDEMAAVEIIDFLKDCFDV